MNVSIPTYTYIKNNKKKKRYLNIQTISDIPSSRYLVKV